MDTTSPHGSTCFCGEAKEGFDNDVRGKIEPAVLSIIQAIDPNPDREGLANTPKRSAKAWLALTEGYGIDISSLFTTFEKESYDQMVLLRDIEFHSLCEHHLLPFFGKAHVAYIPDKRIVGVSKLARVVDAFSRRLQNQERITQQIAQCLVDELAPIGVAVVLEGVHLCMRMRGVEKQNSVMKTTALLGTFKTDAAARDEFYQSIS